jgi:hypothetical protein
VIVHYVGLHALELGGGDEFKLRVFGFDGLVELGVAAFVAAGVVELVFVADLDVVDGEGRGMAQFGADGSPLRGGIASASCTKDVSAGPGSMWSWLSE